jgi:hypothetical protein
MDIFVFFYVLPYLIFSKLLVSSTYVYVVSCLLAISGCSQSVVLVVLTAT